MQGSRWKSPPKSTPNHDCKYPLIYSISIRKQDRSRRRHTRNRYLQIFLIQVYGVTKPLSTQQAELSRACPEIKRRILKNRLCDAPYVRARLFPMHDAKTLGNLMLEICRDN